MSVPVSARVDRLTTEDGLRLRWRIRREPTGIPTAFVPAPPRRTLVMCGGDSDFSDRETLAQVRRRHPAARTETIPGAGHYVHDDRPNEYAALVEAFPAEIPTTQARAVR